MSLFNIAQALSQRLAAMGEPTHYIEQAFTPEAGKTYLSEDLIPNADSMQALNGGTTVAQGIYQVSVRAPRDKGKFPVLLKAAAVRAHFRSVRRLTAGEVTTTITRVEIGPLLPIEDRLVIPVSIYYRAALS